MSEWRVGSAERQQATADAFTAAWERSPWPDGLLSINLFASPDGETVFIYAQWRNDDAYLKFAQGDRQHRRDLIDQAVPGIERNTLGSFRLYRSRRSAAARPPEWITITTVEFPIPDEQRQRDWVDEAAALTDAVVEHFHLSTDGMRAVNYSEWTGVECAYRYRLLCSLTAA